jgi:hypothetical protein
MHAVGENEVCEQCVEVCSVAGVSEVHFASVFRVEWMRLNMFLRVSCSNKPTRGKVGTCGWTGPIGTQDRGMLLKWFFLGSKSSVTLKRYL